MELLEVFISSALLSSLSQTSILHRSLGAGYMFNLFFPLISLYLRLGFFLFVFGRGGGSGGGDGVTSKHNYHIQRLQSFHLKM